MTIPLFHVPSAFQACPRILSNSDTCKQAPALSCRLSTSKWTWCVLPINWIDLAVYARRLPTIFGAAWFSLFTVWMCHNALQGRSTILPFVPDQVFQRGCEDILATHIAFVRPVEPLQGSAQLINELLLMCSAPACSKRRTRSRRSGTASPMTSCLLTSRRLWVGSIRYVWDCS